MWMKLNLDKSMNISVCLILFWNEKKTILNSIDKSFSRKCTFQIINTELEAQEKNMETK